MYNLYFRYPGTECITMPFMPAVFQLAKAYVPFQQLCTVYHPRVGLQRGTIFPELDRPYGTDPEYTVDA